MKQRRASSKQTTTVKDHGKDLYDALLFLITVTAVLWYFNV